MRREHQQWPAAGSVRGVPSLDSVPSKFLHLGSGVGSEEKPFLERDPFRRSVRSTCVRLQNSVRQTSIAHPVISVRVPSNRELEEASRFAGGLRSAISRRTSVALVEQTAPTLGDGSRRRSCAHVTTPRRLAPGLVVRA